MTTPATPAVGTKGSYQGHPFEVVEVNVNGTLHLKGHDNGPSSLSSDAFSRSIPDGREIFVNNVKPEEFTATETPAPPAPPPAPAP